MHKKVSVSLAALLSFSCIFGMGGCWKSEDSRSRMDKATTEDEMYIAMVEAEKNMLKYNDVLTLDISITTSIKDVKTTLLNSDIVYSVSPNEDKMFITMNNSLADGRINPDQEIQMKVGKTDTGYYLYTKTKTVTQTSETNWWTTNYYSISKEYAKSLMSLATLVDFTGFDLEEYFAETDYYAYTAIKNAFDSVFTAQLAERKAVDADAQAVSQFSIAKESGAISLKQKASIETLTSSAKNRVCTEMEAECVGQNDKLVKTYYKENLILKAKSGGEVQYQKAEIDVDYSYEFKDEKYQEIKTDGLSYTSGIGEIIGMSVLRLNINDMISEHYIDVSKSMNHLNFMEAATGFYGQGYRVDWYTDQNYQNAFTPQEISRREFKQTGDVYGKVTVEDGYAVCVIDYAVNDTRDEVHKIVFGEEKIPHYNGAERICATKLSDDTAYSFLPYDKYIHEIYVDGVKQTGAGIFLENKGIYYVKYLENINNSTESIFDIKDYFG